MRGFGGPEAILRIAAGGGLDDSVCVKFECRGTGGCQRGMVKGEGGAGRGSEQGRNYDGGAGAIFRKRLTLEHQSNRASGRKLRCAAERAAPGLRIVDGAQTFRQAIVAVGAKP